MPDYTVRQERTGWRDEWISNRHRAWGWDCPMVDIDFLAAEYDQAKPVAIIEYKAAGAAQHDFSKPSYKVLIGLANIAQIPFAVVRYHPAQCLFYIIPGNDQAKLAFTHNRIISEFEYVGELYRLRKRETPETVAQQLSRQNRLTANGIASE